MNDLTSLQNMLRQQRARRNVADRALLSSPYHPPHRGFATAVLAVGGLLLFAASFSISTSSSTSTGTYDAAAAIGATMALNTNTAALDAPTPFPTPRTMTVCESVTWLHVRFAPGRNAEVRGYLRGGETVTLEQQQGNWGLLSAPVAGWVNMSYLCGGQP